MSTSVDNRVVGLQFDNKNFEKNVSSTLKSLDKLEDSLQFKGAQKGFSDLEKAATQCDLSSIGRAAEVIQSRFSTMGIVGMSVLQNIANKAVSVGENLIRSLAIQPITQGYSEYELKMGSIQTIMASTGESLETVNGYLGELNKYSDRTIYSFADMTQNIGKFTNAGVKLEDAVAAIQGISNEAAISGANAQQASHAMYNFASALSTGSVKLQDWKSINVASMDTVDFKNNLLETANELGTVVKQGDRFISTTTNANGKVSEAFNATKMWNESLQSNWLTSEVLIETLKKYTDETTELGKKAFAAAQDVKTFSQFMDTAKEAVGSGWSETWEIVFGDFEESKKLWTDMSEFLGGIISKSAKARNDFLGEIFDSPWEQLTKKISDTGIKTQEFNQALMDLAKERGVDVDKFLEEGKELSDLVQEGIIGGNLITETINKFANALPGASDATGEVTKKIVDLKSVVDDVLIGKYGNGADRVKALTDAGYDYAEVQDLVNRTIRGEAVNYEKVTEAQLESMGYTEEQIAAIKELAKEANATGSSVEDLINNMQRPSGAKLIWNTVLNTFKGIYNIIDSIKTAWSNVFSIKGSYIYSAIEYIHQLSDAFAKNTEDMSKVTKLFGNVFKVIHTVLGKVGSAIKSVFSGLTRILPDVNFDIMSMVDRAGDLLAVFNDWIASGATITDSMRKFGKSIRQVFSAIPGMDKIITKFDEIKAGFKNIFSADKLRNDASELQKRMLAIGDTIKSLWNTITLFDFSKWKENADNSMNGLIVSISTKFDKLKTDIGNFLSYITDALDLNIGNIAGFTTLLAVGYGLSKIIQLVSSMGKAASEIAGFVKNIRKSFGKVASSITTFIKSLAWVAKAEAFKIAAAGLIELAAAVAVLAGSMWIISQIPKEDLLRSGLTILSLVGVLSIITFATAKFAGKEGLFSIAAVVGSVFLLVMAIKMLSAADMEWSIGQLLYLGEAILAVWALTKITSKLNKSGKDMVLSALSVAAMSAALIILAHAMKVIAALDLTTMLDNCGSLVILFGVMIILMGIIRIASKNAAKAGIGMLAIVGAIYLLIPLLFGLAAVPKSIIRKASNTLLSIFAVFGILLLATRLAGPNAHKAAAIVLAMSFALIPITGVIYLLGNLDPKKCAQGVLAITAVIAIFALLVKAASDVKTGLGVIIALTVAVTAIAVLIAALSFMNPKSVLSSAVALTSVLLALTAALYVLGKHQNKFTSVLKMGTKLLFLAATLYAIAEIIKIMSGIDPARAIVSTVLLTVFLKVLTKATEEINSHSNKLSNIAKNGLKLAIMVAVLASLAGIIMLLSNIDPANAISSAIALSILLYTLTKSLSIIPQNRATWETIGKTATMLAAMVIVVAALAVIISKLSEIQNPANAIASAIALSILLAALTVSLNFIPMNMAAWSSIGKTAVMLGMMVIVIGILGVIVAGLSRIQNPTAAIQASIAINSLLVGMLATLIVCTLLGPVSSLAMQGLVALDAVILNFAVIFAAFAAIEKLFPGATEFLRSGIPMLEAIGEGIGRLVGSIIGGISAGMMNALLSITDSFGLFCSGISDAAAKLKVPEGFGGAVGDIAKAILALSAANLINGISRFLGMGSFEDLSTKMKDFGSGINSLVQSIKYLTPNDLSKVSIAADAGVAIAEMAKYIPNSGGVIGWFVGDNDMGDFAKQFEGFGKGIVALSKSADGIVLDNIKTISKAGKIVAEMASEIPNMGGLLADLIGDNTMSGFADDFEGFGDALTTLSTSGQNINVDNVKTIAKAGTIISKMASDIPNTGGTIAEFFGDNDMSTFGTMFSSFATMLETASTSAKNISLSGISILKSAANTLIGIANGASELSTDGLQDLPTAINSFIQSVNQIFRSGVSIDLMSIKDAGKNIMMYFSNGIDDSVIFVTDSIENMYTKMDKAINKNADGFRKAGVNFVEGFVDGIEDTAWQAVYSAKQLGKDTKMALNASLDERSPSREAAKSGKYFVLGFSQAINRYNRLAYSASEKLGNDSLSAMSSAIARMHDIVNQDPNLQPVIKPIVDMSNVNHSMSDISAAYNKSQIIGITTNHRAAQNASYARNADTMSALHDLGKEIKNISGTSYTINGINIAGDAEVVDAVRTLVRATRMGRRS